MNRLKKILLLLLGEKRYLSLVAFSFQKLYKTEKLGATYQDIYFLKSMITKEIIVLIGVIWLDTLELSRLKDNGKYILNL